MLGMAQRVGRGPTKADVWLSETSIFDDLDELRTFKPDRPLVESISANAFHSKPPALYVEEDIDSDFGSAHGSDDEAALVPDLNGIKSLLKQVGGNYGVEDPPAVQLDEVTEREEEENVPLEIIHEVIDEAIELSKRSSLDPTVPEFVPKSKSTGKASVIEVPVDKLIDISCDTDESVSRAEESLGKCTNPVFVDYSKGDSIDIPEHKVVTESTPAGDSFADKKLEVKKKINGKKHPTGWRNAAISSLLQTKGDFDSFNTNDESNSSVLQKSDQEIINEPSIPQQSTIKLLTPDAFLLPLDIKQNEVNEKETVVSPLLLDIIPEHESERPSLNELINDNKSVKKTVANIEQFKLPCQHFAQSKPKDVSEIEYIEIKKSCQKVEDWLKRGEMSACEETPANVDLPKAKVELKPVLNLKHFSFKAPDPPTDGAVSSYQNKSSDASSFRLTPNVMKNDTSSASSTPGPSTTTYDEKVKEIYERLKKPKETPKDLGLTGPLNLFDQLKEYENGKVSPNAKKKKDKKVKKSWRALLREQNGETEEADASSGSNAKEEN